MKKISLIFLITISIIANAQNAKVQSAWRNISDYESSFDTSSLTKAKDAIHLAIAHEKTKSESKTWLYDAKIHYYLHKESFKVEQEKYKNVNKVDERNELTYGSLNVSELKESYSAIAKSTELDKDASYKSDIDKVFAQIVTEAYNIAIGKHKVNKYEDAADFFVISYQSYKAITAKKDTGSLSNALISAQKSLNKEKIIYVTNLMVSENVTTSYTYLSLYEAQMAIKDSTGALKTLKNGRTAYPSDVFLMNKETEFYLLQGKQTEALANLDKAITQTPQNGILYLVRGNVYDNLANPRESKTKETPKNYEELMQKAEKDYLKASELDAGNFDIWYNLGALYNNWGVNYQTKADNIIKVNAEQKALSEKAQEMFKKAIPAFEKALTIKQNEETSMYALRKLYLLIGDSAKAAKVSEQMKK